MAEEVLQGVVSSICTRIITVNVPGVVRFLDEKECRSILNEMETKFQVFISLKYVPWEPLPHQVTPRSQNVLNCRAFQVMQLQASPPQLAGSTGSHPF